MNLSKVRILAIIILMVVVGFMNFLVEFMGSGINISYISAGSDIILVIIAVISLNIRESKELYITMALFLIVSLLSYIINVRDLELLSFINGLRDFLPYFLCPIIFINIFQSDDSGLLLKWFNRFLYFFLIFQIPVALRQYIVWGAGDNVGGTFGNGGSGELTLTIYLSTFYLMIQDFDQRHFLQSLLKKSYLLVFWLPTFINETKISFVLMILFFVFLLPFNIKSIFKLLIIGAAMVPVLLFFDSIYFETTGRRFFDEILQEDYVTRYMVGGDEIDMSGNIDLPRLAKIRIAFEIQSGDKFWLGYGIGQFKGGTTLALTPFATNYMWLLAGSRPMLFLIFIQTGLLGAFVFILFWVFLLRKALQNKPFVYSRNLALFLTMVFIIIMVYSLSLRYFFTGGLIVYLIIFTRFWDDKKRASNN